MRHFQRQDFFVFSAVTTSAPYSFRSAAEIFSTTEIFTCSFAVRTSLTCSFRSRCCGGIRKGNIESLFAISSKPDTDWALIPCLWFSADLLTSREVEHMGGGVFESSQVKVFLESSYQLILIEVSPSPPTHESAFTRKGCED